MTAYIVQHPRRAATIERTIIESPEANELQNAICRTVSVYSDFLDERGLICNAANPKKLKTTALVVRFDFNEFEICFEGSAIDAGIAS
jgi:hypothetical protein